MSTAILALALPAGWLHGPVFAAGPPATPVVTKPAPTADDSAAAEARRTGRRVEVTQAGTESSQTFVNPDGHHTLVQYAVPTRTRKGAGWVPIDRTLRFQQDGSVRPGAVGSDLTLSGGGDHRLVALGKADRQVRMGWSGTLPKPTLSADTATYREVLPGVDLRIRVEGDGFSEVLVVKTKAAALNPALAEVRFPLSATGLKLTTKPDGTTVATDPAGKVVFSSGRAAMWDSSAAAGRQVAIPTAVAGTDLVIRPDKGLLTGAATRFPLYIDPSWSSTAGDLWTHINNRDAGTRDTSYWDFDRAEGAKVGWAYDNSGNIYRSLFRMGLGGIGGARVLNARFTITLDYTPSSTSTYADLWTTSPIDRSAKVTWNNTQWFEYMAGAQAAAYNTPDVSMGFTSDKLKAVVQQLADQRAATITLGLRAPDEDAAHRLEWKKFHGETAAITVDYNNAPRVPLKVNFTTPKACGTADAPTLISTDHPSFAAIASDPDNDAITSKLSIFRAAGNGLQYSVDSALTSSGAAFGWPELPAGTLSDGVTYYYTATSDDQVANDGINSGPASSPCYFTVDSDSPGQPTIDSTDFPLSGPAVPVRTIGIVNLRPAAGDTDVVEYVYGSSKDKISQVIEAGPGGTAALPVTVWLDPLTHIPTRSLFVKAVDKAGNRSTAATRTLRASSGANPAPARNDVNGDGRTDVSFVLDQGFGRTGVWNVLAKGDGLTTGTMAWDSGDNGGFALSKTKAVQGDFDGDGKADVALFRDEPGAIVGLYLLKSDGNKYDPPALIWRSDPKAWTIATAHLFAGEVTGDTKTDIVAQVNTGNGNWKALVFPGTNLAAPTQWLQTPAGSGDWALSQPVAADVDGDGKADLVSLKNLGGCRTVAEVFKSTGTAFGAATTWYDSGAGGYCWDKSNAVPGDVDGDGKEDLVAIYDNGSQNTSLKVFRSSGTALSVSQWWQDTSRFDPLKASLSVGDYSKDGKADAALVYSLDGGGREVYLLNSTGTAFGSPASGWKEARVGASLSPKYDIEPRTYELVSRNSGRCLEVAGASQAKPADIQQWDCFNGLHQRFRIVPVAGTEQFEIHAVHVNVAPADGKARCFDVTNQSTADNEKVIEWSCLGTANQQMVLEYVEGSSYDTVVRLKFAHSGKCGAIADAATGNGAKLIQSPCAVAANQQFTLRAALNTPQLDGRYKVSSYQGGHFLDIMDCNPDSGVRMWNWVEGSPCQSWQLKPLGDDIYQIIDPSTNTALQVGGCSRADGAPVIALAVDSSDCQRWRIEPAGEGWSIHQADTGKSLDVGGCKDTIPAVVDVWPYWNGPCQRWNLEKVG